MFVRSIKTGLLTPVCGLVGGTKEKPLTFTTLDRSGAPKPRKGFMYQEDNVTFEVNVPPAYDNATFDSQIFQVLEYSSILLADKGLQYVQTKSAHRFPADQLQTEQAQTIGCDPDMCAYGGPSDGPVAREPFDIKDLGTWRFAGGHVHFGYDKTMGIPEHVVARLVDAFVYLPIIGADKQKARRPKYGLAGLYRSKEYGIEYRSMSNFWLSDPSQVSQRAFRLLYDMHNSMEHVNNFYQGYDEQAVKACIDSGGTNAAALWNQFRSVSGFAFLESRRNAPPNKPVPYGDLSSFIQVGAQG
jgi:hypothetical protein